MQQSRPLFPVQQLEDFAPYSSPFHQASTITSSRVYFPQPYNNSLTNVSFADLTDTPLVGNHVVDFTTEKQSLAISTFSNPYSLLSTDDTNASVSFHPGQDFSFQWDRFLNASRPLSPLGNLTNSELSEYCPSDNFSSSIHRMSSPSVDNSFCLSIHSNNILSQVPSIAVSASTPPNQVPHSTPSSTSGLFTSPVVISPRRLSLPIHLTPHVDLLSSDSAEPKSEKRPTPNSVPSVEPLTFSIEELDKLSTTAPPRQSDPKPRSRRHSQHRRARQQQSNSKPHSPDEIVFLSTKNSSRATAMRALLHAPVVFSVAQDTQPETIPELNSQNLSSSFRCYRCGRTGHASKACPEPDVRRCFNCGGIGHIARKCPHSSKF